MIIMDNYRPNLENTHKNVLKILGFGLLKMNLNQNNKYEFEILFEKGIGYPFIQNIIETCKPDIDNSRKGNSIIPLDNFTINIKYFDTNEKDIIMIIYMDKKDDNDDENQNFMQLHMMTKRIIRKFQSNVSISEIIQFCEKSIEINPVGGLKAILILGSNGSPYISRIGKGNLKKSEVHLSGFISALFSFSKEILGEEQEAKLKEINFGNQRFYMINREDVIFAFLVEDMNPILRHYMYLMVDDFLNQFKNTLKNFHGDVTPFEEFNETIDIYFKI